MLGLGAIVLIRLRVQLRLAWFALIGAVYLGGAIFCLTITKSGLAMLVAGLVGFILVLLSARNPRCRAFALVAIVGLPVAGALFLAAGPPSLSGYLRGEIAAVIHPDEMGASMASSHSGLITRYKCWKLALVALRDHPFGVGPYGLGTVVQEEGDDLLNNELQFYFSRDIFGLKNALANLIADTGVVGLGLLFYWLGTAFLRPIRHYLSDGTTRGAIIAGIYGASALSCVVFLFSCELYPSFAFLLVLKFHADAIAQACAREPRPGIESLELIG
jgi:O-antigen ligase